MSKYVIGIDIGTGSTKALAIDASGKTIASSQVHYNTSTPSSGFCEQDPEIVWRAFVRAIATVVGETKRNPEAIVLSSAMHSVVAVDSSGSALAPMMIWADNRSASIATRVHESSLGELLYEQNGTPIHAMAPLCKIIWLRENNPQLFEKAARLISIKEFIWFKIFREFEIDHSIASATGLMNIESCTWNESALHLAKIGEEKLSSIVPVDRTAECNNHEVCSALGITSGTTFIIGSSDGCLANLGSFATDPGVAALTIGTSGAIRLASRTPIYNFQAMTFNYRLWDDLFISGGPINNGGGTLKWYVNSFLKQPLEAKSDYEQILTTIAGVPAGADGLIFLPYLYGDRAPIWNSDACGVFFGARNSHHQAHFTRAVVEGISFSLFDVADHMMQAGSTIQKIHVSGGFVSSQLWLQILADIFGKQICLLNNDDASAFGAALIGLKQTGLISDIQSLKPKDVREINPDASKREVYLRSFDRYRKLYAATKELMTS